MRFFKSCRIVKRTRAREMLFRVLVVSLHTLRQDPGTPGSAHTDSPVPPKEE